MEKKENNTKKQGCPGSPAPEFETTFELFSVIVVSKPGRPEYRNIDPLLLNLPNKLGRILSRALMRALGRGNHEYRVQYYRAWGKHIKNNNLKNIENMLFRENLISRWVY